ncbi:GSCOCG00001569001-RA-CDS [Cotesia congregata]|nr:GSCOCG00001569001-RA-CDS [Cotesia congregata]
MMLLLGTLVLCLSGSVLSDQQLKLVHVVFSHKLYAPIKINEDNTYTYPEKLDYKYFLESTDDMVNSAKMDIYNLGVYLRKNYNSFLGEIFHPDLTRTRTTEYPLSMISGLLVNVGLWPPAKAQVWQSGLNWQPVPTDYISAERDTLLLGSLCPSFSEDEKKAQIALRSPKHELLYSSATKSYGSVIKTPSDVALLSSVLQTIVSVDSNMSLPAWTLDLSTDISELTFLSYDQLANTDRQKKLNGGTLLKKIISDSLTHQESNGTSKLKIIMYSAEDRNIIGLLKSINLWSPHYLSSTTALIFETYSDTLTNKYSLKMMFYSCNETVPLKLKNCNQYCPIDKFSYELKNVLPENATALCEEISSASPMPIINSVFLFILLSLTMINIY